MLVKKLQEEVQKELPIWWPAGESQAIDCHVGDKFSPLVCRGERLITKRCRYDVVWALRIVDFCHLFRWLTGEILGSHFARGRTVIVLSCEYLINSIN